ncbi:MAG: two-component system response regulator BaeR [Desulfuromonas sp.]|nr:MAG: two-component system response regulator BaeR [Desulfuromonas sp.]
MGVTILIVEDEPRLAGILRDYLLQAGMRPHCIGNGLEVVDWVREHQPNLMLLDLMLPGKDGMEVCKEVRTFSDLPIIMVTARVEEIDRLLGLELGADDYICKPFSPREVVARVKAVLRRSAASNLTTPQGLTLDDTRYLARINGCKLDLTAIEYQLLSALARTPGRIFSRDQLMSKIYPDQRTVEDRTIDSHIKKLRKKLSVASAGSDLIHSVYGVGYKYERT